MLPDSNRALYEDLSASVRVTGGISRGVRPDPAAYRSLSEAEQEAFLDQFWLKRDPTRHFLRREEHGECRTLSTGVVCRPYVFCQQGAALG